MRIQQGNQNKFINYNNIISEPTIDEETPDKTTQKCYKDGIEYEHYDFIPSDDLCTDCFCFNGEILCATQECPKPNPGCTPMQIPEGSCCPEKYECGMFDCNLKCTKLRIYNYHPEKTLLKNYRNSSYYVWNISNYL